MAKPCRLCLQYCDDYEDASKGKIHNHIFELFSFRITSSDESTSVCSECFEIVNNFYLFYKQVKKIQEEFVKNSNIIDDSGVFHIKEELNIESYETEDDNLSCDDNDEFLIKHESDYADECSDTDTASSENYNIDRNKSKKIRKKSKKSNRRFKKDEKTSNDIQNDAKVDSDEESNNCDANIDLDEEFPSEIFRNGELILKGPPLDKLLKKFYNINCDICKTQEFIFTKLSDLFRHYEMEHETKGYVNCCNTRLYERRTICLHMARHIQPSAFECPICKKPVSRPNTMKLHMQTHLPHEEKPHKCDQCNKTYSCIAGLTRHKLKHLPIEERTTYTCNICGKVFFLSTSLTSHMATIHSGIKFLCPECGRSFKTKTNLTFHMVTHDSTGKNKTECTVCGFVCKNKQSLQRHAKLHSSTRFNCTQCRFSSHLQHKLNTHMRVKHSDVRPYVCTVCGKRFKVKNVLTVHMAQHTGERKFACPFCPKTFASSGNFYTHRKRMHGNPHESGSKRSTTISYSKINDNEGT